MLFHSETAVTPPLSRLLTPPVPAADTLLEEGEADTQALLNDYTVPDYFQEDLLQVRLSSPPFNPNGMLPLPPRSG